MWLADENIPAHAIAFLRQRGEDVLAIAEAGPGIEARHEHAHVQFKWRWRIFFTYALPRKNAK